MTELQDLFFAGVPPTLFFLLLVVVARAAWPHVVEFFHAHIERIRVTVRESQTNVDDAFLYALEHFTDETLLFLANTLTLPAHEDGTVNVDALLTEAQRVGAEKLASFMQMSGWERTEGDEVFLNKAADLLTAHMSPLIDLMSDKVANSVE